MSRGLVALARGQQPCLNLAHRRYGAAGTGGGGNLGWGSPGREGGKEHCADRDRKCGQPACCHGSAHKTLPAMPATDARCSQIMGHGYRLEPTKFLPRRPACNRELQESEVLVFVGEGGRRRPRASGNQSAGFGHLAALIKLGIPASIQADRGAQASSLQIEPDQPALRR